MNTPYTTRTGIKIGYRYNESPKPQEINDTDMLILQKSLIFNGRIRKQENFVTIKNALMVLSFILLIVVAFWMRK